MKRILLLGSIICNTHDNSLIMDENGRALMDDMDDDVPLLLPVVVGKLPLPAKRVPVTILTGYLGNNY